MVCPKCGGRVKVIDTASDDIEVFRKRKCVDCKHVFFTRETETDIDRPLQYAFCKRWYKKKGDK